MMVTVEMNVIQELPIKNVDVVNQEKLRLSGIVMI